MPVPNVQAFKVNEDGCYILAEDAFGNLDFQMVEDVECVEQDLRIRLKTTLGEDFLHPEVGIPFARIWNATNSYLEDRYRIAAGLDPDIGEVVDVASGSAVEEGAPDEGGDRKRTTPVEVLAVTTDDQEVFFEGEVL